MIRSPEDKKKSQSEIVKRRVIGQDNGKGKENHADDPFTDDTNFNFKKSKSDKKMTKANDIEDDVFNNFQEKKENDLFENANKDNILSGKRKSNNNDQNFDFDDNFAAFDKKKKKKSENMGFDFEENNFGDQFNEKPKKKDQEDFNFDFGDQGQDGNLNDDPFNENSKHEEVVDHQIKVEPRRSENLNFGDPFDSTDDKEEDIDPFGKNSEDQRERTDTDPFEENHVQTSAGRKK
jgi:hypothetical protein